MGHENARPTSPLTGLPPGVPLTWGELPAARGDLADAGRSCCTSFYWAGKAIVIEDPSPDDLDRPPVPSPPRAGLPASAWLAEMIAERRLSQVRPNMARSSDLITQARAHIGSARKIASTDSTLALAACQDAIRKALDPHAGAMGYRFENSPGAHRPAIDYGRQVLGERLESNDLDAANRLRNRRHGAG